MDKCASLMSAHRWTRRTHTQPRTESSCCAKLQCVYRCSRLRFITVHTQTVAVFLCQCLMRGWESGDLTAVRSSCSLELPPVPIHSLKALTHAHTHSQGDRHTQACKQEGARTKTCLYKHTHLTKSITHIHWFSHPVAPLSVLDACKQVIVVGWAWLPDRSYKDHGNINWYISYSSSARLRWQRESCCQWEWSRSGFFWHRCFMEIWTVLTDWRSLIRRPTHAFKLTGRGPWQSMIHFLKTKVQLHKKYYPSQGAKQKAEVTGIYISEKLTFIKTKKQKQKKKNQLLTH